MRRVAMQCPTNWWIAKFFEISSLQLAGSHDDSDDYHDHDHNKLTKMNNDICKCSHNIKNLEGRNSLDKLEQEFFDKNYHGNLISIP